VYWRLGVKKDVQENPAEDYSADVVARYKAEIKKLEQELAPHRTAIAKLESEQKDLDAKISAAVDAELELNNQLEGILGDRGDTVRLAQNIVDALKKKATANTAIEEAAKSIDRSDKELEAIRKDSVDAQERLSSIFNTIVRSIAGTHMSGELRFTKIETNAGLFRGGEVVSEAFNAIKALAYDFTALTAWLNGIGHHPGFLLHDSPRESDMEPSLYQPYFHFVAQLAEAVDASFQYIVTTTEPPPDILQTEPPICLKLDGSSGDGSLYREIL
jgi:FtsZ-binding cell division protein ZapB